MKSMVRKTFCVMVVMVFCSASRLYAQPGFDDDVEDTPIDSNITVLILGCITLGVVGSIARFQKSAR